MMREGCERSDGGGRVIRGRGEVGLKKISLAFEFNWVDSLHIDHGNLTICLLLTVIIIYRGKLPSCLPRLFR